MTEDQIRKACNDLADLLVRKNHDYGNSVEEQFNEYGLVSVLVRLDDKMRRLKNLKDKNTQVDEKLQETAIDLAGYSVLLSILLDQKEEKPNINFEEYFPSKHMLEARYLKE